MEAAFFILHNSSLPLSSSVLYFSHYEKNLRRYFALILYIFLRFADSHRYQANLYAVNYPHADALPNANLHTAR